MDADNLDKMDDDLVDFYIDTLGERLKERGLSDLRSEYSPWRGTSLINYEDTRPQ